jgi:ribose transport system permease protein
VTTPGTPDGPETDSPPEQSASPASGPADNPGPDSPPPSGPAPSGPAEPSSPPPSGPPATGTTVAGPALSARPAAGTRPAAPGTASWLSGRVTGASETWLLIALVILIVVFSFLAPGKFLTVRDFSLTAQDSAWLLVMAVGETFVILTAGIDLSVGSVLVLAGVVTDLYCIHHGGAGAGWGQIAVGCLLGLITGLVWGIVQGFLVAKAKVPPLIVTLGGFYAAGQGVAYLITGGADFRTVPSRLYSTIGLGNVPHTGVPWEIVISFLVAIAGGLVLAFTRFGRWTYATGSNPEAARRSGINVDRHLIKIYGLSGLLAGVGGILSLASFDSTTIAGHSFDNLQVITAVVLGGASLFGGRGSMIGSFLGLAIAQLLQEGLVIAGVNEYWQEVAIGAVLVAAVYLDQLRRQQRGGIRHAWAGLRLAGRQHT